MFKLKFIIVFLFFSTIGFSQEIFIGEYSSKYVSPKSINESNSHKNLSQLILFKNNRYKLTTQTFVYIRKIKKKWVSNCSIVEGKWKKEDDYLILISDGFNNLTTYKIKNKSKIVLFNNSNIKFKKVEKLIEINCKEKDDTPINDLNSPAGPSIR